MNLHLFRPGRRGEQGNLLIITLITTTIIGMTLSAYLSLVDSQNLAVARSQTWNLSLHSCEAGIEEALQHINTQGMTNRTADGWTVSGTNVTQSRTLGDGRFEVFITTNDPPVILSTGYIEVPLKTNELARTVRVITRRSGGAWKGLVAKGGVELVGNVTIDSFDSSDPTASSNGVYMASKRKDNGFIGSVNGSVTGDGGIVYGSVGTGPPGESSLDPGSVGDASFITGGGSGVQAGHYDNDLNVNFPEVDPPFSGGGFSPSGGTIVLTNFAYSTNTVSTNSLPTPIPAGLVTNLTSVTATNAPAPPPSSGVITNASGSVTTAGFPVVPFSGISTNSTAITGATNAPATGTFMTPPGVTTVSTTVKVGTPPTDVTVTTYNYEKILSYSYTTKTYTYDTTSYAYDLVATNIASVSTNTYAYLLGTGNYQANSLSMSGSQTMYVSGHAVLYLTGTGNNVFQMTGNSEIIIGPNGSLNIYSAGEVNWGGNGVSNQSGIASGFGLYGLPTCDSIKISGNAAFTGVIYAPDAYLQLGGGGSDTYDVVGAAVVGKAKVNGKFNFHYDELLGRKGGEGSWVVDSWEEL